ncbi:hypothetical protein GCM10011505_23860 [Tistrella bauzanensis]|uniref:Sel1 repeat family protein n=1 Tax=Tistrella bauzanensis TaxID=657419 RepID=A0ABQ1IHW0_9PROT|nr:hypothetical protein GCM10011505_23860 [Tistrella bauzanensis]
MSDRKFAAQGPGVRGPGVRGTRALGLARRLAHRCALLAVMVAMLAPAGLPGTAARAWTPPQGYATAAHAWEAGDYATARPLFERLARAGDARAAFYAGVMAEQGQGAAADPVAATEWYREAAAAGHVRAAFNLARLLEDGVPPALAADPAQAARSYAQAAAGGIVAADTALALMQLNGRAGPVDAPAAQARLRRAAATGDGAADHALALRALAGDPPDMVEALARARRASLRGHQPAGALVDRLNAAADPALSAAADARMATLDEPAGN